MKETLHLLETNQLTEAFGSGTACVVCPIEAFLYKDKRITIPTMTSGAPLMNKFAKQLNEIHYGKVNSRWAPVIN
jgi:branched-chain amino acid aminotransferase